jgi:hypothetical protein
LKTRLTFGLEHALVGLQRFVQARAKFAELKFEPDFAVGASVAVVAPYVFGVIEREAASIGARSRPGVIVGGGEVRGLLKLGRGIAGHVTGQLLAVVRVCAFEVAIAIDAVEVEIALRHGPEQVLGPHDFVEKLSRLRRDQHRSMGLNRA